MTLLRVSPALTNDQWFEDLAAEWRPGDFSTIISLFHTVTIQRNLIVNVKPEPDVNLWTFAKQECIPVGCVPAERWPYSGAEPPPWKFGGTPPKKGTPKKFGGTPQKNLEVPPKKRPPPKKAPPRKFGGTPPKKGTPENLEVPPQKRHPQKKDPPQKKFGGTPPSCEQNEWQTPVKILPWPKLRFGR